MKRNILLLLFTLYAGSFVIAQDKYEYDVKPDELISQEVTLKGPYERDELKIMLGVRWWEIDHRIQLVFDRKQVNTNDAYLLFFPFLGKKTEIKEIVDCKFGKKSLWTKVKGGELSYMNYFIESDNLQIDDFKQCYKSLANNNEEEFEFALKEVENEFTVTLNGLYVARTSKRPWYTFSKRDKKLEFKALPVTLLIRFPVVDAKKESCEMAEKVVPYVHAVQDIMLQDYDELMDAQKRQNCTLFGLLKDKIRRMFIETNDKCERYKDCEEIAEALKAYNDIVQEILDEVCKAAPVAAAACSFSENELSAINNRLKNLQMKINIKKKDGNSTAEEFKEYQSIKTAVNPKLSQECRKRYKNLIDAYSNYCTIIEGLLK